MSVFTWVLLIGSATVVASFLLRPALDALARSAGRALHEASQALDGGSELLHATANAMSGAVTRSWRGLTLADRDHERHGSLGNALLRPLWYFLLFVFLAGADFYAAALAFAPLLHIDSTTIDLPIDLLMGLLWAAVAAAFGTALLDSLQQAPRRPLASLTTSGRRLWRWTAASGLLLVWDSAGRH
jgi:hypothetical protein